MPHSLYAPPTVGPLGCFHALAIVLTLGLLSSNFTKLPLQVLQNEVSFEPKPVFKIIDLLVV